MADGLNQLPNDIDDSHAVIDTATAVAAAAFGQMPLNVSFAKAAYIEAEAERVKALDKSGLLIRVTDADQKSKAEREEDDRAEKLIDQIQYFSQAMEAQRQHEAEWLQQSHTYAGQSLTGEEWKAMASWFSDSKNIAAWEQAMMAQTGQTIEEVRQTGGKMKRFYDLVDKDAKGTLTDKERSEFTTLQNDQDVRKGVETQKALEANQANELARSTRNEATIDGNQLESVNTRRSLNEDVAGPGIAAAPLSPIYARAASGQPLPAVAPTAPIAANTIQVSPDNMFG